MFSFSLGIDVAGGYPYEVESGIASILFPVLYNENALKGKCGIAPTECPGPCADCPAKDYRKILKWVSFKNKKRDKTKGIKYNSFLGFPFC